MLARHILRPSQRSKGGKRCSERITCRCSIQQSNLSAIDDVPVFVHLYQVTLLDEREGNTERVHPEGSRVHRIAQCNVAGDTLIEAIFALKAND